MPPSGLSLRGCELRDLGQVGQIEKDSFPERPYTRLDFVYFLMLARKGFIVASVDGQVVGYVIATSQGRVGSIQSIAVLQAFRKKGVGETLMRSAISQLSSGVDRVRLLVDVKNSGAIRLYRKLLFEETGRVVRRYYPDGSDAMEMTRKLQASRRRASP